MESYCIKGGNRISGEYRVSGAKNAALPVLAATILTDDECILGNVPEINDVKSMGKILKELGAKLYGQDDMLVVDTKGLCDCLVSLDRMKEMRSSVFLLGALLGRCGSAIISQPGGCNIGARPIDLHLYALKQLGVHIEEKEDHIICLADRLQGNTIDFSFPSVGATENAIMAAVRAKGTTVINNCAKEPEIIELQDFLNKCGARINGAGTSRIIIEGVEELRGCTYSIMPDRIECGTYLVAAAITGGELTVNQARPGHMVSILEKLVETGCEVYAKSDKIYVKAKKRGLISTSLRTGPYPDFPTDLQSPFLALLTLAKGEGKVRESIFENRFHVASELKRMGAEICVFGNDAIIQGVDSLVGTTVKARDLRGGAALVCAGLAAEGETVVEDIAHIERGYSDFAQTLNSLGGNVSIIREEKAT